MAAMIAGQASRVDEKRARILFDGMRRSWYPTAPSMWISVFSPGLRANGFGFDSTIEKSISGMKSSSLGSGFVFRMFALRGAPCGDDPRPRARRRDYHDQQSALRRPGGETDPILRGRVALAPLHTMRPAYEELRARERLGEDSSDRSEATGSRRKAAA
jgi:hypothetical protein